MAGESSYPSNAPPQSFAGHAFAEDGCFLVRRLLSVLTARESDLVRLRCVLTWRMNAEKQVSDRKRLAVASRLLVRLLSCSLDAYLHLCLGRCSTRGVCLLQNRSRIIEVYKRWLWYVDMRWDHRRMVESNMQNMQ